MWQNQHQRTRALANARRRERERMRIPLHIKRVNAIVETESADAVQPPTQLDVRVVLNDLSAKGVSIFSPSPFIQGQILIMSISDPVKITLRGKVINCQEHAANSHILTNKSYSFRIGIEFVISGDAELDAVKSLIGEISRNYLYTNQVA